MRENLNPTGPDGEGAARVETLPSARSVTGDLVGVAPPDLSVVIPVHNEAANVVALLGEIRAALEEKLDYEVIVVDDGSGDDTLRLLDEVAGAMPALRIVRHDRRYGQSAGILSGARAARAAWIVTMDGDGQNDPADIPALLAARDADGAPEGLQMVAGRRANRHDNWLRRASSRIANRVRGWVLRDAIPDSGCGLKLVSRSAFMTLPQFDHFHRFLPALIKRNGGEVVSVSVSHRPRGGGRSHYGVFNRLWIGIIDLFGVMWLQRRALRDIEENRPDKPDAMER